MRNFLFLVVLLALPACGKFERLTSGQTSVSFRVGGSGGPAAALPGIMVYAVRANDVNSRGARYLPSESASLSWAIPNGVYNFYAFGYQTAGLSGAMYCGSALNKALSGGSVVIPLVIDDQNNCGLPPFSPTNYGYDASTPKTFSMAVCASSGGDISLTDGLSVICDGTSSRPAAGSISSYKISFFEYTRWDPNQAGDPGAGLKLTTGCVNGGYNGNPATTSIMVPFGQEFMMELEIFSSSSCSTYAGSFTFMKGLINASDNSSIRLRNASDMIVSPALQMAKPSYAGLNSYLYFRNY